MSLSSEQVRTTWDRPAHIALLQNLDILFPSNFYVYFRMFSYSLVHHQSRVYRNDMKGLNQSDNPALQRILLQVLMSVSSIAFRIHALMSN
jgi:hypothetical protein